MSDVSTVSTGREGGMLGDEAHAEPGSPFKRHLSCSHGTVSLPDQDVLAFHRVMRLVVRDRPVVLPHADWSRRVRLILEELAELAEAQAGGDLEGFADAIADLAWVVIGTAVEAGIPFQAIWGEVRRANMAKTGGVLDASGKLLKPAGWRPPDHRAALGVLP